MKKLSFILASLLVCLFICVSASAETVTFGPADVSATPDPNLLAGSNKIINGSQWTLTLPEFVVNELDGSASLEISIPVSSSGYITSVDYLFSTIFTGDATGSATESFLNSSMVTLATKTFDLKSGDNKGTLFIPGLVTSGFLVKSITIDPGISKLGLGSASLTTVQQSVKAVPEPMTLSLLGLGLASLGVTRRKRNR